MTLSAKDAADQVGLTKQGIIDAIKKGRVSANKNNKGHWIIEPVELFRVFPPVKKLDPLDSQDNTPTLRANTPELDTSLPIENMKLQLELEAAHKQISQLEQQREEQREHHQELREERNEWREQAKRLSLPNPDHAEKTTQKPLEARKKFLGIFSL